MAKKKKDFGNNYFPSGWGPKYDFDEQAGVGEITHVGTDPNYKSKFDISGLDKPPMHRGVDQSAAPQNAPSAPG